MSVMVNVIVNVTAGLRAEIMEGSMWKKSKEELRKIQELRRSNAASPLRDLKKYSRKVKNAKLDPTQDF